MFSFLKNLFATNTQSNSYALPSHLLEQANSLAGSDAVAAQQLRSAALAALCVVR